MIKINLLPYREVQKREKIWLQLILMGGVIFVAFLCIGILHWQIITYEKGLNSMKEDLKQEIADLDKKIGQIDKIKSQKAEIERKLNVIDMLNTKRIYASEFLFKLANAVPDRLWLTSIEEREKEVLIVGEAEMASNVSTFMERLNGTGLFQKISLLSLEQQSKGEQKVIRFTLSNLKAEHGTKP